MKLTTSQTARHLPLIFLSTLISTISIAAFQLAVVAPHASMEFQPEVSRIQQQSQTVREQEFKKTLIADEMPETIVTPEAVFTRYQKGSNYYFFKGGSLVLISQNPLPKLRHLVSHGLY